MTAILKANSVVGLCHNCQDRTTFEFTHQGNQLNRLQLIIKDPFDPRGIDEVLFQYQFCRCSVCGAGGLVIYKGAGMYATLVDFYPMDYIAYPIPENTPAGIKSEFREAERCSGIRAYRAGAAMLRSTLEKTLKDHGYTKRYLSENLKDVGADEIIPVPLKQRASEVVKVLGDDVLHKEWREITEDEFESAHKYIQRVLEAFYDYPEVVKKVLEKKGRSVEAVKKEEPEAGEIEVTQMDTLQELGKIPSIRGD